EQLVNFEGQPGVEERGCLREHIGEGWLGRRQRQGSQRAARALGALTKKHAGPVAIGAEPFVFGDRPFRDVGQTETRGRIVKRGQDRGGEPVAGAQRQRRNHTVGFAAAGADSGGGATRIGRREGTRSTRLPAIRSCSARLSRRSPAMTNPIPTGASEAK